MAKIIDIGTGRERKSSNKSDIEMIKGWAKYADHYFGEASCVVYFDKVRGLSFIAPSDAVMISLIENAYLMLKSRGVIRARRAYFSRFLDGIHTKLLNLCLNRKD